MNSDNWKHRIDKTCFNYGTSSICSRYILILLQSASIKGLIHINESVTKHDLYKTLNLNIDIDINEYDITVIGCMTGSGDTHIVYRHKQSRNFIIQSLVSKVMHEWFEHTSTFIYLDGYDDYIDFGYLKVISFLSADFIKSKEALYIISDILKTPLEEMMCEISTYTFFGDDNNLNIVYNLKDLDFYGLY